MCFMNYIKEPYTKMYSLNTRVFLMCSSRVQFFKRLIQARELNFVCLKFSACCIQRSKKSGTSKNLFTPVTIKPANDFTKVGQELAGKITKTDIIKVLNLFFRKPEVKVLSRESGLDDAIFEKGFVSFRKFCVESTSLPADLHIVFSDLINNFGNPLDLFPYFLLHVREMFPHLECMDDLKKIGDIREPATWFPEARKLSRKFYYHCGPTNSGKTYNAIQKFLAAKSGIYCAPLKLLAVEIHQKANQKGTVCDLVTGEEVIYMQSDGDCSSHVACTIEMCPLEKLFEVAIIDEIQMLRDMQRGWAWTRALLGLQAREIHICGEESAIDIVDSILCTTNEQLEVKNYERLTTLKIDSPLVSFKNILPGDCIVCFNKNDIYTVAKTLESYGNKVAIIYGSLPPQTKLIQCEKFNDPNDPCNILVATDAVGMGLNLNIRRIIFYSIMKKMINETGDTEKGTISVSQALQIAGRAGRYGTQFEEGFVTTFKPFELKTLRTLLSETPHPINQAGLLPTIEQIELFSYYLPKSSLFELIDIFYNLCTVDDSLYFMCDMKDFKLLAQLIDHIALPLKIKFIFCCAPVNKKLQFVCVMFVKFAKLFSLNQVITADWVCEKIGWPLKKPESIRELVNLEIAHELLELYLWLSYRFEEYFPDGHTLKQVQTQIDSLIQEGVQNFTKMSTPEEGDLELEKGKEKSF